jgi:uncharacterized protein (TIGR00369 family)
MTAHPAAPRRTPDEQRRLQTELDSMIERRIAFNELIGLRVVSSDPKDVRMRFDMRPALVGHHQYGRLHGGAIASALDATAGFALMVAIGEKFADESTEQVMQRFGRIGTIDLRIDFLRPGIGRGFEAGARVTRLGGRLGSVQMTLHSDEGMLVATGAASFVVG